MKQQRKKPWGRKNLDCCSRSWVKRVLLEQMDEEEEKAGIRPCRVKLRNVNFKKN